MIRIGLKSEEKQKVIDNYLESNNIRKVYILYHGKAKSDYNLPVEHEYIEWDDIIMYKFFYRLLEEITDDCLIIVDELMRTQNRSELTYNCSHHYLNQTPHRIIFEYFPIIDNFQDFMILLDFHNKDRYTGKSFSWEYLQVEDIQMNYHHIDFIIQGIDITEKQLQSYEKQKEKLFDEVLSSTKDPNTVPRNLHIYAGNWKKPYINANELYIARNSRFKLDNVTTYQKPTEARIVVDFPHRRIDFNDYLKLTGAKEVRFISTGLSIDNYYITDFREWLAKVGEFYGKTSLHR